MDKQVLIDFQINGQTLNQFNVPLSMSGNKDYVLCEGINNPGNRKHLSNYNGKIVKTLFDIRKSLNLIVVKELEYNPAD